jgi:hypothetical protein
VDLCLDIGAFSIDIKVEGSHFEGRKSLSSDSLPDISETYDAEYMATGITAQGSGIKMASCEAGWVAGCCCAPRELAECGENSKESEVSNRLSASGSRVAVDDTLIVLENHYTMLIVLFWTT